ncbi:NAD(P)/FAD-dependent oxidoreductase [Salipiger sp.]|uniref:NAD(P)/FAD-dependent oxidoreductase n=1 Tax=Salipiger sp. TaxID=2078585 RepID=UPI003A98764F
MAPGAEADVAIIGGGIVGLSVAWGLLNRGHRVVVLDGSDGSFRASRGNFGLVWVQGKGASAPAYARWTRASAAAWPGFAEDLRAATGIDPGLRRNGGLDLHFTEDSLARTVARYRGLAEALGGDDFEILGNNALRELEPEIGPAVAGGILHRKDGHANPMRLLRALAQGVRQRGAQVLVDRQVVAVERRDTFRLRCADGGIVAAQRVVLAAGLGAATLGPALGFRAPIRPQRGQVLITERLPKLLNYPSVIARQVDEGGIQIGATEEEVGTDDGTTPEAIARMAADAVRAYPALARVRLVRSWGALRILTPDGLPIYAESPDMPGAYMVTCHSGITLAAAHARLLPAWLDRAADAPDLEAFRDSRFP